MRYIVKINRDTPKDTFKRTQHSKLSVNPNSESFKRKLVVENCVFWKNLEKYPLGEPFIKRTYLSKRMSTSDKLLLESSNSSDTMIEQTKAPAEES